MSASSVAKAACSVSVHAVVGAKVQYCSFRFINSLLTA